MSDLTDAQVEDKGDERTVRFSLSEVERLGLDLDELLDDVLFDAVAEFDADTDDPEESGDHLDVPIIGDDSLDQAAAAGIAALQARGVTSAHLLG